MKANRRTMGVMALAAGLWVILAAPALVFALATEEVGNAPVNERNYSEWAGTGMTAVLDHPSRVYHRWVNGNEVFHYEGDAKALSATLAAFAAVKVAAREVHILPGAGKTTEFNGSTVTYGWTVHLLTGLAAGHFGGIGCEIDVGERNPTLTIYADTGKFALVDLEIPSGLTLVGPAEMRKRYLAALAADDSQKKGFAAAGLAGIEPDNAANAELFAPLLNDKEAAYSTVYALARMGANARGVLPAMKAALAGQEEPVKKALTDAIAGIEKASAGSAEADKARRESRERIDAFLRNVQKRTEGEPKQQ